MNETSRAEKESRKERSKGRRGPHRNKQTNKHTHIHTYIQKVHRWRDRKNSGTESKDLPFRQTNS